MSSRTGSGERRKPLYVEPVAAAQVSLDDVALRIDASERAGIYVPLCRISRVVACPRAQFTTEALLACAEHGITVLLHDDEGVSVARVTGRPRRGEGVGEMLSEVVLRKNWRAPYSLWLESTRDWLADSLRRRFEIPATAGQCAIVVRTVEQIARDLSDRNTAEWTARWFAELSLSTMLAHCHERGIGGVETILQDRGPDVVVDLGNLLAFGMEPARIGWLRSRTARATQDGQAPRPISRRDTVRVFEHHSAKADRLARAIIDRLDHWLRDMA